MLSIGLGESASNCSGPKWEKGERWSQAGTLGENFSKLQMVRCFPSLEFSHGASVVEVDIYLIC